MTPNHEVADVTPGLLDGAANLLRAYAREADVTSIDGKAKHDACAQCVAVLEIRLRRRPAYVFLQCPDTIIFQELLLRRAC